MKRADLKERSSMFIIGKGLIIAAILVTSSLSFTLGYFVGKSTIKEAPEIKPLQETPQDSDATPVERENLLSQPVETLPQQQSETKAAAPSVEPASKTEAVEIKKEPKTRESQKLEKPTKIIYTVQVGAFKDAGEADALKARLDKKGYKVYVTRSEAKRDEKLYKVRIGEFSNRKDAEILAIKIKKTEGLQPFVTFSPR
jgi:DedD protein